MTHQPLLRRLIALLIPVSMVLAAVPVRAASFADVGSSTRYATAIHALRDRGIIQGYANGTFRPLQTINRAEFLKIVIASAYTKEEMDTLLSRVDVKNFPDVPADAWYADYVYFALAKSIIAGYDDGTFKPERTINFVEASKILTLAFNQQPQTYSPDWFEPYVRALESSKAIPPTIAKLDAPVTRGEMAEMLWRLLDEHTDQETKGFLNVKFPDATVNFASDEVQVASSCADLRAVALDQGATNTMYYRGFGLEDAVAQGSATKSFAQDGDSYSQTNVQVQGVDEADIVKTDGEYLYLVRGQSVKIVKARPSTALAETATISFAESNMTPQDLYIDGSTLVVIGSRWVSPPAIPMGNRIAPDIYPPIWWGTNKTDVRIYDVSNAASPRHVRTVSFDGTNVSTRRIEGKVYVVLQQPLRWGGPIGIMRDDMLVPKYEDSAQGGGEKAITGCAGVTILPYPSPEYLTVAVVPTDDADADIQKEVILGGAQNVYMSLENLYVATTQWHYVWDPNNPQSTETTTVFRFAVTGDGVAMEAKGDVPGHILNQFSMDEHENSFRIATTKGQSWDSTHPSTNNLYVLNMNLERVSAIEDIAPGETIYSVRFMGDRTYMVTFQKVDPFFVIDTSDPRHPKILGKLKIPGYSDYLHPYDETHIIGFGKEAVEAKEGNFAWYQGMKVAIFDVSDVANPKEMHKLAIGDRGTESPLLHTHKALLFEKARNLLAFPITVAKIAESQKTGPDGSAYGSPVFQGAYVYDIGLQDGFKLRGTITHYDPDTFTKAGDYWYGGGRDVERVIRIDDALYTVSQYGVQSHDEKTVVKEGGVTFKE